jgi:hypothetical protein
MIPPHMIPVFYRLLAQTVTGQRYITIVYAHQHLYGGYCQVGKPAITALVKVLAEHEPDAATDDLAKAFFGWMVGYLMKGEGRYIVRQNVPVEGNVFKVGTVFSAIAKSFTPTAIAA